MSAIFSGSKNARAEELVERHARRLLDHGAEDVGVVAVDVLLAGLRGERQAGQPLHQRADRLVLVGEVPSEHAGGLIFLGSGPVAVGDAGGVRQQVADGDLALRGDRAERPPAVGPGTRTDVRLNAGRDLDTGSASRSFPSSISITAATEVTALLIDASRKIVSFFIGTLFSTSILPIGLEHRGLSAARDDDGHPGDLPRST